MNPLLESLLQKCVHLHNLSTLDLSYLLQNSSDPLPGSQSGLIYQALMTLVLACNLATVFPIGAYVKVDFKVGTLKRTDGQKPPM